MITLFTVSLFSSPLYDEESYILFHWVACVQCFIQAHWGGGFPPKLRIPPPPKNLRRGLLLYVNVIPVSLLLSAVTVIIYSLTFCEASGLAARAYRFILKHTILYTHKFILIAGVWSWHNNVDFTSAFTSRLQSSKTKVRQVNVPPRQNVLTGISFRYHAISVTLSFIVTIVSTFEIKHTTAYRKTCNRPKRLNASSVY